MSVVKRGLSAVKSSLKNSLMAGLVAFGGMTAGTVAWSRFRTKKWEAIPSSCFCGAPVLAVSRGPLTEDCICFFHIGPCNMFEDDDGGGGIELEPETEEESPSVIIAEA